MKRERRVTDFLSIYAVPVLIGCAVLGGHACTMGNGLQEHLSGCPIFSLLPIGQLGGSPDSACDLCADLVRDEEISELC